MCSKWKCNHISASGSSHPCHVLFCHVLCLSSPFYFITSVVCISGSYRNECGSLWHSGSVGKRDRWMTADWQHCRAKTKGSSSWWGSGQRAVLWGEEVLMKENGTLTKSAFIFNQLFKFLSVKMSRKMCRKELYLSYLDSLHLLLHYHTVSRARMLIALCIST